MEQIEMTRHGLLIAMFAALLLPGVSCAQEKPKKAEAKTEKAAAPAAPKTFEPVGANYVSNASFEDWKAGVPTSWNIATGAGDTWKPVTAKQDADAQEGKVSISLPAPKADESVIIAQSIGTGKVKLKHEARLMMDVAVKTPAKKAVHVVLSFKHGDKEQKIRRIAAGTDQWEKLHQEFWIPKDADLESFRISITRLAGGEGKVLVDDVKVQLMAPAKPTPPTPAPNPAAPGPKLPPHGVKIK